MKQAELEAQLALASKVISQVEGLLTNLQPHIPQACHSPKHAQFIDNYVDPALHLLRTFLSHEEKT